MADFCKVEGLDVFAQALKALPENISRRVLRQAVAAAGKVIRDEAKEKAPFYYPKGSYTDLKGKEHLGKFSANHPPPGTLKRAIAFGRSNRDSGKGKEVFNVFVRHSKNGSSGQKGVKAYGKFDAYYARFVEFGTSKMAAHPFLRPAFEAKKEEAVFVMTERIGAAFPDEAKKLGFGWVKYQ